MRGGIFFTFILIGMAWMILSDKIEANDFLAYLLIIGHIILSIKLIKLDWEDFKKSKYYDSKNKFKSFFKYQKNY